MKHLFITFLAGSGLAFGQSPVTYIEYGPVSGPAQEAHQTAVTEALKALLEKAEKQLSALDDLTATTKRNQGDYTGGNSDSVMNAKAALDLPPLSVLTTESLMAERNGATGDVLFEDSANGVFNGIGRQYEGRDSKGMLTGDMEDRDPTRYEEEAQRLAGISDFYRVRDESLNRQTALELARQQAHIDLLKTADAVETQRLTALIASINADLVAIRADVANASHEADMYEKAKAVQAAAQAKAKTEGTSTDPTTIRSRGEEARKQLQDMIAKLQAAAQQRADAKAAAKAAREAANTVPPVE
jgi:hypothetical protein